MGCCVLYLSSQARELGLLTIHDSQVITEPQLLLLLPLPALAMYLRYPDGHSSQFAGICNDGYFQLVQTSPYLTTCFQVDAQCQTVPHPTTKTTCKQAREKKKPRTLTQELRSSTETAAPVAKQNPLPVLSERSCSMNGQYDTLIGGSAGYRSTKCGFSG